MNVPNKYSLFLIVVVEYKQIRLSKSDSILLHLPFENSSTSRPSR